MDINSICKILKKDLDKDRFRHTIGVMYTAASLAMANGYDIQKSMLTGLLHDCAKCLPAKEKIDICRQNHIEISDIELANPSLLHAKAGAIVAREKYGIKDKDILHAITVHTTGVPDMNILDKIIFIADYIEPNRDKAPRLELIRQLAFKNLDECTFEILADTLNYLSKKSDIIDNTTRVTYEYYKQLLKE